ncbi:hypothetical protein FOZ60_015212 [Perkinsus olseni]|uniref:Uncharacterized protein n=1 Tax=Perkinsus olseni TaxID=32597 RepID=A0A7J6N6C6_PEROL|nr:hypothetical protein FOZ60_015212 [Perkinsus olseni]
MYLRLSSLYLIFAVAECDSEVFLGNKEDYSGRLGAPIDKTYALNTSSKLALSAQVVNTIVKHDDGSLSFHNTDTLALAESIRTKAALASTCLVVGTGGAARAACAAAELLGMEKIFVWGREPNKAAELAQDFVNGQVCPSDPGTGSSDVIIGCVPAGDAQGLSYHEKRRYIPQKTPLTRTAGELGCRNIVHGLEILGIEQSMLWTGMPREAFGTGTALWCNFMGRRADRVDWMITSVLRMQLFVFLPLNTTFQAALFFCSEIVNR